MDYPRIRRDVNVFPITLDGRTMVAFQDSQRLSQGVLIPQLLYSRTVAFFDGEHSCRDIQYEVMKRYGDLVYKEQIEEVVERFDKALLLESPRLDEALEKLKEDFRKERCRAAFFSGEGYAAGPSELASQVKRYFVGPDGPGTPAAGEGRSSLRGIMAPHIDFQRGGHCYAWAYKALAESEKADLYIILGIAHTPSEGRFCLTRKDFQTPFGIARTDQEFVEALSERCLQDLFQDEFLHRAEHSIEFQVVFLQWILGADREARIVPILCGSFDRYLDERKLPEEDPSVSAFLAALKSLVAASDKRVAFISGVDLSHVGPQFGDPSPVDGFNRREIRDGDLAVLDRVANLDVEGFFRLLEKNGNRTRICGFPAIYVQLRAMEASRGEVLKYDQGPTPDGRSLVSFTAMAFYG